MDCPYIRILRQIRIIKLGTHLKHGATPKNRECLRNIIPRMSKDS